MFLFSVVMQNQEKKNPNKKMFYFIIINFFFEYFFNMILEKPRSYIKIKINFVKSKQIKLIN